MRLICFWCVLVAGAARAQEYYAPQTFRQDDWRGGAGGRGGLFQPMYRPWNTMMRIPNRFADYQKGLFTPAGHNDVIPQGSIAEPWRPLSTPVKEHWSEPAPHNYIQPTAAPVLPKIEPWRPPYQLTKEQQAAILHHKQSLTSEGAFRFEYASDNGLAAGEVIEPDGSRVGAYQYKDPSGQLVKLKYRAGKDGFQILEGSHLPKSPEPVPPPASDHHYRQAYEQQRKAYELQQQYNLQRPQQQYQSQGQGGAADGRAAGGQYFVQNWRPAASGREDDGQYRENEVEEQNRGPHTFGEGYEFAFQG